MDFAHLHVHSEYSLLDGLSRIPDLVAEAKAMGMSALALTDHGNMHGTIEFYKAAQSAGIKPIIGCEVYCAQRTMRDRQPKLDASPYHLTLLAINHEGYRNLIKLVTKANLEGFYYKPRIDLPLLEQHNPGLIALSGCLGAQVPQLLLQGQEAEATKTIAWFHDVFGPDRYYLELQNHNIPEQQSINRFLVDYAHHNGIPYVCTNDVHYVHREDAEIQDILLCVQTGTRIDDPKRMRMATQEFYLKSPAVMASIFAELPDALSNTLRIAEQSTLTLEFGRTALPEFTLPKGYIAESYFRELTWKRLPERYEQITEEIRTRVQYELDVICQLGFAQYLLIVADFITWARNRGIMAEVRGSVGGSIVAYILGISEVDPILYNLPFERFLSPERREMPDIDTDFPDDRRAEVYEYVKQKYGPDHVAQIITFNTMLGKAAIRDVGRALGYPLTLVDRVAKLIPNGVKVTIDQGLEEAPELRTLAESDPAVKRMLTIAQRVEGLARNASVHAAGVVISREPLAETVPLQRAGHADVVTQYDGTVLQEVGLLKMDFLGLANLSTLDRAVKLVKQTRGITLDLKKIPHDDPATFALLQTGETTGLFQLESAGMRKYLKELKPTSIGDISAMISLYRPGPMANIPKFIAAKNGHVEAQYLHPDLEPILKESYGVIVYQEQVMAIVMKVAGFTTEQGYKFIKAIAKKNAELLQQQKEPFVAGALERGYSQEIIEELWRLFEPFQRYSFNKAHTMAYAHVTYRTAYMKTHFPAEFMAAVLCSHRDTQEKLGADITECRRMGITVLPPDINHSEVDFSVENGAIRFGLAAIKNVGSSVVESLVAERQRNGPFTSLENFCQRIDARTLNKKALESLIKAGCLDCFGDRASLLPQIDRIITLALQATRTAAAGKISMFDHTNEQPTPIFTITPSHREPTNLKQYYSWERELLGVYFGEHPLNALVSRLHQHNTTSIGEITEDILGTKITIAGMLTTSRTISTKSGQPMLYATIEDLSGTIEVVVFPRLYENTRQLWEANHILLITGRLDQRNDSYQVICDSVERLPELEVTSIRRHLRLTIPPLHDPVHDRLRLERVAIALRDAPGSDTVELRVRTPMGLVVLATPTLRTQWSPDLEERIQQLLGRDALEVFHQPYEPLAVAS